MLLPGQKYELENIGKGTAVALFLVVSKGSASFLTKGVLGKVTYYVLSKLFSYAASKGLVLLNVGISNVEVMIQQKAFDTSWDEAFKAIASKQGSMTDAEKKQIDDKVISAFERFADMSRK